MALVAGRARENIGPTAKGERSTVWYFFRVSGVSPGRLGCSATSSSPTTSTPRPKQPSISSQGVMPTRSGELPTGPCFWPRSGTDAGGADLGSASSTALHGWRTTSTPILYVVGGFIFTLLGTVTILDLRRGGGPATTPVRWPARSGSATSSATRSTSSPRSTYVAIISLLVSWPPSGRSGRVGPPVLLHRGDTGPVGLDPASARPASASSPSCWFTSSTSC